MGWRERGKRQEKEKFLPSCKLQLFVQGVELCDNIQVPGPDFLGPNPGCVSSYFEMHGN